MRIETARLYLEPWSESDFDAFRPIATDPLVMRYITHGAPWADEQIRAWMARQMDYCARLGTCHWKVVDRSEGALAGLCGIQPKEIDGVVENEIGWWLRPSHWGRGLATEAARAALEDGFGRLGYRRIVAIAMPDHTASIRIMEKLGMVYEAHTTYRGDPVVKYAISRPSSYST